MSDYADHFRSVPTETLEQRLKEGRLLEKTASAYRQVLAERASYVPTDISGHVSVSGHSGCYYAEPDEGQQLPKVFDGQNEDSFLIGDELVDKHHLGDGDRIVFQVGPDMVWVTEIMSVYPSS